MLSYDEINQSWEDAMTKMSIREITRNFKDIDKYDYIEIEDKKTNTIKGIIVSGKYLDEIRAIIKKVIEEKGN